MSESAISNLGDSLDLISNMIDAILKKEAEFQKLIAQEIAEQEEPDVFIRTYDRNDTMVKLSLIRFGETEGVSIQVTCLQRMVWTFQETGSWTIFSCPGLM